MCLHSLRLEFHKTESNRSSLRQKWSGIKRKILFPVNLVHWTPSLSDAKYNTLCSDNYLQFLIQKLIELSSAFLNPSQYVFQTYERSLGKQNPKERSHRQSKTQFKICENENFRLDSLTAYISWCRDFRESGHEIQERRRNRSVGMRIQGLTRKRRLRMPLAQLSETASAVSFPFCEFRSLAAFGNPNSKS